MNNLFSLLQIQENLLQYYRTIFITAQSIIFSLAVALVSNNNVIFSFILIMPGLITLYYWYTICSSRGHDVSFVQYIILKVEKKEITEPNSPLTLFKSFQAKKFIDVINDKGEAITLKDIDNEYLNLLKSNTRKKMEVYLPSMFLIMWIILIIINISKLL
jgi:hypothetical protein